MTVVVRVLGGDGAEGAFADVQGDHGALDAGLHQAAEELEGEVQAGGGRCDGAGEARVDGLVALAVEGALGVVAARTLDVRRQGHAAGAFGQLGHGDAAGVRIDEAQAPGARRGVVLQALLEVRVQDALLQLEHLARAQAPRGADLGAPAIGAAGLEQQDLHGAAAGAPTAQARGAHVRLVHHDQVPGAQDRGQVAHVAVLARVRADVVHEQPCGVARLDGDLGDPLGG